MAEETKVATLSPTDLVLKEFRRFLESDKPEVICIRGRWGVGKTFAWNKVLRQVAAEEQLGLKTYSYVSLFGVTSLDHLKYSIFENRTSDKSIATGADLGTLSVTIDTMFKAFGKTAVEALAGKNAADMVQSGAFLAVRNQIVCIDDVERKGKDLRAIDILGLVSMLVEQRSCKVVIILNDEQLEDERKDFVKYQEKVVDRSLNYAPSPEECIKIVLEGNTDFGEKLGSCCARLKISNIRIIKKIENLILQIYPLISGYDQRIIDAHVQTIALFGWAHYAEHGKPEENVSNQQVVDFILNRYSKGLYGKTHELNPEEERIEAVLRMYQFGKADEADAVLNDGIKNGYFDEAEIKRFADLSADALKKNKFAGDWAAVWDTFHNSFDDDEKPFVAQLMSAFASNVNFLSLGDLNHSVKLLKRLKYYDEASHLLKSYMAERSAEPDFFNLNSNVFGDQIDDPDVRKACAEKFAAKVVKREPHELLLDIYRNRAWNHGDIELLAGTSVEDYYMMFKMPLGEDHRRLVASALHFREFADQQKEFVIIVERAEEALRRIAKENDFNDARVDSFRIRPAPELAAQ